jgi:hypothetical protein
MMARALIQFPPDVDSVMAVVVEEHLWRAWLWRSMAKVAFNIVKVTNVPYVPAYIHRHPFFPVLHRSDFGSAVCITMQMPGSQTAAMTVALDHQRINTALQHLTTACLGVSGHDWVSPFNAASAAEFMMGRRLLEEETQIKLYIARMEGLALAMDNHAMDMNRILAGVQQMQRQFTAKEVVIMEEISLEISGRGEQELKGLLGVGSMRMGCK